MALFEPPRPSESEEIGGSDAATRALSVTVVENDFVARVYENIAWGYDVVFGPVLHPGRVDAIKRMKIGPGDRVLEVGVGTGINVGLYPADCAVTGIDLSSSMLEKARERVARKGVRNVRLLQMDAANLKFADDSFDIVYAPYVISGKIVIVNHFRSDNRIMAAFERMISPLTVHVGFKSDLDLPAFLAQAGLKPDSIQKVNFPRIWTLVTCVKE
jgi:phosphatidylethanolamine/phosphatidyl-N-methylethanolamine N-methyltransferase